MHRGRWLTVEIPGTGGTFTPSPEDFEVEELPLYEPCGEGEHLYLRVEKTGLSTRELVRRAMTAFGADEADVGYAGLKDKHARTVQTLSVRGAAEADAALLEGEGVRVLGARRHRNKLRVGHLAGNRFRVLVRGAGEEAADGARQVLERLAALGLPNYYGEQRFGARGDTADLGRAVLRRGTRAAGSYWKAKLAVSALQADLFNAYLEARMGRGAYGRVLVGDVLQKAETGGLFTCADAASDQARHDRFEISVTGPIFGHEMRPAEGEPGGWEAGTLAAAGLTLEDFRRAGRLAPGTRRALRAPVRDVAIEERAGALALSFTLPSGSYATVLIDEVMKPDA
jgi:tRNA pseudouridine13 synthase